MRMSIRNLSGVFAFLFVTAAYCPAETVDKSKATLDEKTNVAWYDARLLTVEGQGWQDVKSPYDRLPAKAEKTVRDAVWSLSRHSAGIAVRFATDSPELHARWTLNSANLAMPHMPATGVSGVDLYVKTEGGKWRWLANGRPTAQSNTEKLASGITPEMREYMLYLPLYNGVSSVEVGIKADATITRGETRPEGTDKPIVFYGTSITHGGCASRPGMVHTAILGRWLDRPVINLGFSGNGRMETEVAELMAELDPCVFVLDCLPNINADQVTERTEPVVHLLRKAHPNTPILLVEDRNYTNGFLLTASRNRNLASQKALREAYDRLVKEGVTGLYYLEGEKLLDEDGEGTVDSSHPTDLGFMQHAHAFRDVLAPVLKGDRP